jgi:hypothetical protein
MDLALIPLQNEPTSSTVAEAVKALSVSIEEKRKTNDEEMTRPTHPSSPHLALPSLG